MQDNQIKKWWQSKTIMNAIVGFMVVLAYVGYDSAKTGKFKPTIEGISAILIAYRALEGTIRGRANAEGIIVSEHFLPGKNIEDVLVGQTGNPVLDPILQSVENKMQESYNEKVGEIQDLAKSFIDEGFDR